jgi:Fe-S cluster assembly protein SufD
MSQVAERHETFSAAFEAFRRDPAFGPEPHRAEREAAFRRFLDRGFPTTREEEWRFTSLALIADVPFVRASRATHEIDPQHAPYLFAGVPFVMFVNGHLHASGPKLPEGLTVGNVSISRLVTSSANARKHGTTNPFVDLNTAFAEDAAVIEIGAGTVVSEPIHVLYLSSVGDKPSLVSPRLTVRAGEQSEVTVIESYAGLGSTPVLTSAVTDFVLGPGAVVNHVKVQREPASTFHVASMFADLGRASTLNSTAVSFGGRIARNDIVALLDGEGAECTLNGLYVYDGNSLFDTHTTIDHAKPHCPSHEVYKGILGGKAKAVFNGKIIVRPDAQKTDAKQTNKALLLTDDAQINTKPQLEIFADDVKCTHGAAIGQLDDDAMFYLRARGIPETEARSLLIHAFAAEILSGIKVDAVRARVQEVMEEKLRLTQA